MPKYTINQFFEDLEAELAKAFSEEAKLAEDAKAEESPKEPEPAVDPTSEAFRLLKKAEAAVVGRENEAELLIQIADRHVRIIEAALVFQS